MLNKLWGDIPDYTPPEGQYLSLKKLNFLIGTNNSGKSRLLRLLFSQPEANLVLHSDTLDFSGKYSEEVELLRGFFQREVRQSTVSAKIISKSLIKRFLLEMIWILYHRYRSK